MRGVRLGLLWRAREVQDLPLGSRLSVGVRALCQAVKGFTTTTTTTTTTRTSSSAASSADASASAKVDTDVSSALAILRGLVGATLDEMASSGTLKSERVITSPQDMKVSIQQAAAEEEEVLNMCANNYLGLSNHPDLVDAAKKALESHGFGLSSVRFICGTTDLHLTLEDKLSTFHGTESTILYPSCFDANAGLFECLLSGEDAVLSDALNHASIIDGIRLCKAKRLRYNHLDMQDLEEKLIETQSYRQRLIATDGVFSMDGSYAPLDEIVALARKYNALVFVDECHATGFVGKTGRGTEEHCGLPPGSVDVINSTLGKALGGATGGYTTGRKEVVDLLRQKSRPYLFSNTLAPSVVAASNTAMDMVSSSTILRDQLEENTKYFRQEMSKLGFSLNEGYHPIVPIMLGDAKKAMLMAEQMLEEGVYVIGFCYPVVPKDTARIRVQVSGAHTKEHLDKAIQAFAKVGRSLDIIK